MIRWLTLILLVSCASQKREVAAVDGRKNCRDGVCLFVTRNDAKMEVFEVHSELSHPIKFTLKIDFAHANAVTMNKGQITKVINPNERVEILSLNSADYKEDILFNYKYWWQ